MAEDKSFQILIIFRGKQYGHRFAISGDDDGTAGFTFLNIGAKASFHVRQGGNPHVLHSSPAKNNVLPSFTPMATTPTRCSSGSDPRKRRRLPDRCVKVGTLLLH